MWCVSIRVTLIVLIALLAASVAPTLGYAIDENVGTVPPVMDGTEELGAASVSLSEQSESHSISVRFNDGNQDHCTVEKSSDTASQGDQVTVTLTPESGWRIWRLYSDSSNLELSGIDSMEYYVENIKGAVNYVYKDQKAFGETLTLTFTMPNKDVTLFLNLDDGVRNIYIGKEVELEHGSVTVNNSAGQKYPDDHAPSWTQGKTYVQAHIGATVTATIRPDEGYGIKNLNIIKQDHQPSTNLVDNGDGTYTFTMHDDESTHAYYSEVIGYESNNAYYNTWVDVCPSFELLVSISEGTSLTKTYGDDDFTLTGTLGTNVDAGGTWTWTSNDTSAIEIKNADTATPTLHINKASTVPVTVTATYKSDGTTVGTATIDVTVNPASVEVPTAATGLKWNGTEQTGVAEGAGYTVTDGKKTDAGNYTAIASLDSKTNYVWNDGTTADKSIEWSIAKADAVTIGDVKLYHYFNTMSQDVSASLAGKMPEDAGKLTYAAGTATKTGDLVVSNFTVDDNGNVSATLSGGQSGDTATLPVTISSKNYEDSTVNVIVTVTTKDDAGVSISEGSSLTKTYGDDDFTLTATASNPGSADSKRWTWINGNEDVIQIVDGANTATPKLRIKKVSTVAVPITAIYESGADTSGTIGLATIDVTVSPKGVALTANSTTQTYDGTEKSVEGFASSVEGLAFDGVSASGKGTDAGTYDVTFSGVTMNVTKDTTGNYVVSGTTDGKLTISPAEVTLTGNSAAETYDGTEKSVEGFVCRTSSNEDVALTFDGVTARGAGTNAGTYPVTFSGARTNETKDATGNYVVAATTNGTLTIDPKEITATVELADNSTITYDGTEKKPVVIVKDGETVVDSSEYTVTYGNNVNAGTASIAISDSDGGNYVVSGSTTFTIAPASVEVPKAAAGLRWTGKEQTGVAEGNLYVVTGGKGTAVGEYVAVASLRDKANYAWADGTTEDKEIEWSIGKADDLYVLATSANGTWVAGSDEPLVFTVGRTVDDGTAIDHFVGIEVDGAAVSERDASGSANYTVERGSVVLRLQPSYLATLALGSHSLRVTFDDGNDVDATFTTVAASSSGSADGNSGSAGSNQAGTGASSSGTSGAAAGGGATATTGGTSTNASGSTASKGGTTAKTGDATSVVAAVSMVLAGAAALVAGRRRRR